VPLPFEPNEYGFDAALPSATRLFTSVAGVLALITSTLGTIATVVIGAKSFWKS
jgi:hypothetical protein